MTADDIRTLLLLSIWLLLALAACSVLAWPLWRACVAVGRTVLVTVRGGGRRG